MAIAPQFAAATLYEESSSTKVQLDGYDYLQSLTWECLSGHAFPAHHVWIHAARTRLQDRRTRPYLLRGGPVPYPANCEQPG